MNFVIRALRLCDPPFLKQELNHIRKVFERLCYPKFFIDKAFTKARSRFYNPPSERKKDYKNCISLPFHHKLLPATQILRKSQSNVQLVFSYNNSLSSKLVHNKDTVNNKDVGVYSIPCKDCSQRYIGESGRGLSVRINEHKNACRRGQDNNMIAKHVWDRNHRIDWDSSKIIYKSNDIGKRRVVEGALIGLLNTFDNNKAFTSEDPLTNLLIIQSLNINLNPFIAAPDARSTSSSPVQVLGRVATGPNAGADAVVAEVPEDSSQNHRTTNSISTVRRSSRLANEGIT